MLTPPLLCAADEPGWIPLESRSQIRKRGDDYAPTMCNVNIPVASVAQHPGGGDHGVPTCGRLSGLAVGQVFGPTTEPVTDAQLKYVSEFSTATPRRIEKSARSPCSSLKGCNYSDNETFDRVQKLLDTRGYAGERKRKHDHYLKGTLWCGRCRLEDKVDRRMIQMKNSATQRNYLRILLLPRCSGPHLRHALFRQRPCRNRSRGALEDGHLPCRIRHGNPRSTRGCA